MPANVELHFFAGLALEVFESPFPAFLLTLLLDFALFPSLRAVELPLEIPVFAKTPDIQNEERKSGAGETARLNGEAVFPAKTGANRLEKKEKRI